MAPKRKNPIVTLDDIRHRKSSSESSAPSSHQFPIGAPSSSSKSGRNGPSIYTGNDSGFCQPANNNNNSKDTSKSTIPCHVIPNLPQSDVCASTLVRIHQEFLPIIQRRGYNVQSISEFCCCGDGLDYTSAGKRRKCRRMGDNVLGYNQTVITGRSNNNNRRHSIHLRLRHPRQHDRLFPWEDVAGTMAHELAHCVHGPHNDQFFKLMDEILEEHYQMQLHGPNGPSWLKPTNTHIVQRSGTITAASGATTPMADAAGGQRLGGGVKSTTGKSRLLDELANGRKLGGGSGRGGGPRALSPRQLRELAAKAAETRQRQLQQVRRMAERANEPCVIEILDDDDEEEEDAVHVVQPQSTQRKNAARSLQDTKPAAKRAKSSTMTQSDDIIDLTADSPAKQAYLECVRCTYRNNPAARNCAMCTNALIQSTVPGIECNRCTFRNKQEAVICEICGHGVG